MDYELFGCAMDEFETKMLSMKWFKTSQIKHFPETNLSFALRNHLKCEPYISF